MKLTKHTNLPAHSGKYKVTVPVKLAQNVPNNITLRNVAYVCADNATNNPTGPNGEDVCDGTPPPPPGDQCTPENNPTKDPACILTSSQPKLVIDKQQKLLPS